MSNSGTDNRRAVIAATVIVLCLLVLSGVGYRAAAEYVGRPADSQPLPPDALARLPMEIGGWSGSEAPLDEAMARATDTDAHISRRYRRRNGTQSVWAYVAYGVQARDLMPHRPEVCYPLHGWTLRDTRTVQLPLADGTTLECRILRFRRGGLGTGRVTVLNYYIVDGQYCPDVSLLRSKAWHGSRGVRYMAQVQISCSSGGLAGAGAAERSVRDFAIESARAIHGLVPDAEAEIDGGVAAPPRASDKESTSG